MKSFFKQYFTFNQVELKGIRVLLAVLVFMAAIYFTLPLVMGGNEKFDSTAYQATVDTFIAHSTVDTSWQNENEFYKGKSGFENRKFSNEWKDRNNFQMKPFDPNGLPKEIWMEMGLSDKQAQVIKNFESKGGKFKTKEDVKKQFVISDEFYKKIEPYLVFAEINDDLNSEHAALSVDINHATKEDFMLLNGVKDYLAEGIIKYRSRLGGFTTKEQLKEIKYLSQNIYDNITPHCFVTSYSIKKININLAEWGELAPHPYIGGDVATKIINHRKKNGIFKNADDFKQSGLVDEALYTKLVPYLSFTH